jgi:hypothetical protein
VESGREAGDVTGRGERQSGRQMEKGATMVSEGGKRSTQRGGRVVSRKGQGGSELTRRCHISGGGHTQKPPTRTPPINDRMSGGGGGGSDMDPVSIDLGGISAAQIYALLSTTHPRPQNLG